jgi:putative oxidoreductase
MYLMARLLIALLFLGGAVQKFTNADPVRALLDMAGWPQFLVWPAMLFNLAGGLGLLFGPAIRWWALALAAYCGVTSYFHLLLGDAWQITIFVKNWAIAGGLLAVYEVERLRAGSKA